MDFTIVEVGFGRELTRGNQPIILREAITTIPRLKLGGRVELFFSSRKGRFSFLSKIEMKNHKKCKGKEEREEANIIEKFNITQKLLNGKGEQCTTPELRGLIGILGSQSQTLLFRGNFEAEQGAT